LNAVANDTLISLDEKEKYDGKGVGMEMKVPCIDNRETRELEKWRI